MLIMNQGLKAKQPNSLFCSSQKAKKCATCLDEDQNGRQTRRLWMLMTWRF